MRVAATLSLTVLASGCGLTCGKKAPTPSALAPVVAARPAPATPAPAAFAEPVAGGLRWFRPPRGQEVLSVSASPDGRLLAAATARAVYLFDETLGNARAVELPGLVASPGVVALSERRVIAFMRAPTEEPRGRVWAIDAEAARITAEEAVEGAPVMGAALAGDRAAIALSGRPRALVYDAAAGRTIGSYPAPGETTTINAAADRTWATLAGSDGVTVIDVSGEAPVGYQLPLGPGKLRPTVAQPAGSSVLVAGAENGTLVAVVVPRRGGEPEARLALGSGEVLGAALDESGTRAAVFLRVPAGQAKFIRRTQVLDATTWSPVGVIPDGPAMPGARAVAAGSRLVVTSCRAGVSLDLAAMTAVEVRAIPSPPGSACLDGAFRVGDLAAARADMKVVAWPAAW